MTRKGRDEVQNVMMDLPALGDSCLTGQRHIFIFSCFGFSACDVMSRTEVWAGQGIGLSLLLICLRPRLLPSLLSLLALSLMCRYFGYCCACASTRA